MPTWFNLAHGAKALAMSNNYPWPYDVDICFDDVASPVALSEGVGWGSAGCQLTALEALAGQWRAHFDITNGLWLIPYLERRASGIPLPKEEMLLEAEKRMGKPPESYVTAGQ